MGTSEGVKKGWALMSPEARQTRISKIANGSLGKHAASMKLYWASLTPEQKEARIEKTAVKLRGGKRPDISERRKGKPLSQALRDALASMSEDKKHLRLEKQQATMKGRQFFLLHPEIASYYGKQFWADPEKARRIAWKRPTKPEKNLLALLDQNFPSQWKYVGDGQVRFGGKCPDFINVNGQKLLIEVFGVHWHNLFDASTRTDHFRQYGFDTLIVWEDELKNPSLVIRRIQKFKRGRHGN